MRAVERDSVGALFRVCAAWEDRFHPVRCSTRQSSQAVNGRAWIENDAIFTVISTWALDGGRDVGFAHYRGRGLPGSSA